MFKFTATAAIAGSLASVNAVTAGPGEPCLGWNESAGEYYPECSAGLVCRESKRYTIPGMERRCLARQAAWDTGKHFAYGMSFENVGDLDDDELYDRFNGHLVEMDVPPFGSNVSAFERLLAEFPGQDAHEVSDAVLNQLVKEARANEEAIDGYYKEDKVALKAAIKKLEQEFAEGAQEAIGWVIQDLIDGK